MEIEFHRLENSSLHQRTRRTDNTVIQHIVCTFKTDRLGVVKVVGTNKQKAGRSDVEAIDIRLSTPGNKPDINVLAESEQAYVAKYMTAVLLLTFYPHELVN